jgi:D-arginine dehydrogenase
VTSHHDVIIVGGGIAAASLGARLAGRTGVLLIEAEDQCGYHTSGRSAAFWMASYGGGHVQPLSLASHGELASGWPTGERSWLSRRGALHLVGPDSDAGEIERVLGGTDPDFRALGREELEQLVPGILDRFRGAFSEPSCADIDVAGLLAACLAQVRRAGGTVLTGAPLTQAERRGGCWQVETPAGAFTGARLVNAAGAWGDQVAERCGVPALGLVPKRRTVVQLRLGRTGLGSLPLVDFGSPDDGFYFKGEGDCRVWLSPTDQTPDTPRDVAAEEEDVAVAIDRFQRTVDWPIEAVERRWAGLRTFAPGDRLAIGEDPLAPGLYWSAGLGGWGFQTAPAVSALVAALILGEAPGGAYAGLDPADYRPR